MSDDEVVSIPHCLIDLSNIPNNRGSGLDTEKLEWVSEQSNERLLSELISNGFLNFLMKKKYLSK